MVGMIKIDNCQHLPTNSPFVIRG